MSLDPVSKLINDLEGSFESRETSMVFRNCKKALKEKAKNDELSQEQRVKILSILCQAKHSSSTNMLFRCPRIWKILKRPDDYPAETELVKEVDRSAIASVIRWLRSPADSPPIMPNPQVIDVVYLVKSLGLTELVECHPQALTDERNLQSDTLDVEYFYKLCSILPNHSFKPPHILHNLLGEMTGEEIAAEYDLFKKMKKSQDPIKKDFPAEKLLRFYLFIKGKSNKALEQLLENLKSGKLDREYAPTIISTARSNSASTELLHRDKITIALGDLGETTCSLWPFFLKSELLQSRVSGDDEKRVVLEGEMARAFPLFYRTCIKGAALPTSTASSLADLRGIWACLAFFQISDHKFKRKFFENINALSLQIAHPLLIELYRNYPDDDLRKFLFSFLDQLPFINIDSKGAGRIDFHLCDMPNLIDLKRGIEIIKAEIYRNNLKNREFGKEAAEILESGASEDPKFLSQPTPPKTDPSSCSGISKNATFNTNVQHPASFYLYLCSAYYCEELGLQEHKKDFEEKALCLEDSMYFLDHSESRGGVFDAAHMLIKIGEPLRSHLHEQLKKMESPPKRWLYACEWAEGKTPESLDQEKEMFKEFVERGKALPASLLPSFLYHIGDEAHFKKAFEACLQNQDESFNFPLLRHVIKDLKTLYGIRADKLLINVPQQIPLALLLKMKRAPSIFYDIPLCKLPSKAVQEAIVLLDKLTLRKDPDFKPEEVRSLSPDHFKALELLQEGVVGDKPEFIPKIIQKLAELIPQFPKECLPAAGAWAYPHNSYFFNQCSAAYCGENKLELSAYKRIRLLSLTEESLTMLAAMDLKGQHQLVHVNISHLSKVAKACPNLENIEIQMNSYPSMEELQGILTDFKNLKKCEFFILGVLDRWIDLKPDKFSNCNLVVQDRLIDLEPYKSSNTNLVIEGIENMPTPNPDLPTLIFNLIGWRQFF